MSTIKNFLMISATVVVAVALVFNACKKPIKVASVSLDKTELRMFIGDAVQLVASVFPDNADDITVAWSSNAPDVVRVSETGELTALSAGNAIITVKTNEGGFTASCNITVPAYSGTIAGKVAGTLITWSLTKEGVLTLESSQNAAMPNSLAHTFGDRPWFGHGIEVTRLVVREGVTEIGEHNFRTAKLQSVQLGNSVTTVGKYAFYQCDTLTTLSLGSALIEIGNYAFSNCYVLKSVTFPASLQTIQGYAFQDAEALTELNFPASIKYIGDGSFINCRGLTKITVNWKTAIPAMTQDPFIALSKQNITLSIPKGTRQAYSEHIIWQDFNIQERDQ